MSWFDRTGPLGTGSLTGRGKGPCGFGLGRGRRFGAGRGLGRFFCWGGTQTPKENLQALKDYKQALKEEIEDIEKEEQALAAEK